MTRISVPGSGWFVEVDLPGGTTLRPDVVGDPSRNPTVNGYPQLSIPTRKRDLWNNVDIETNDVPMRVWFDGQRQPVDQLERVREGEGETSVLEGRGGLEARQRVRKEVDVDRVSSVVTDLVTNNTPYTANVDQPPTTVETTQVADVATDDGFEGEFLNTEPNNPVTAATDLSGATSEGLKCAQTAFWQEGETASSRGGTELSDSDASNGEFIRLDDDTTFVEETFTLDYDMPESHVVVGIRYKTDGTRPAFDVEIDGTLVKSFPEATGQPTSYAWLAVDDWSNGDLTAGDHTVLINHQQQTNELDVDGIVLYDGRYHDSSAFDNTVDSNGYLASPTLFPTGNGSKPIPRREFGEYNPVRAVVGGFVDVTPNDTAGVERLGVSNDRGKTWSDSSSGVSQYDHDFTDFGSTLRWRIGLQGFGSRTSATPTEGYQRPEVQDMLVEADLEDIPLIITQSWDDSLQAVLADIAQNYGDFIYEYRIDNDGTWSVEWTQPGLRTSTREDPITRFEAERSVEELVGEVVIKGGAVPVQNETWAANIGTSVSLAESDLIPGSETVRDPNTGTTFIRGDDYTLDALDGAITALDAGDLQDGTDYEIDYDYHPTNSHTSSTAPSGARTIVRRFPQLTSTRACGQVARLVARELDTELREGRIVIPSDRAGWNVVAAVDYDVVPFDDVELRDIENTPEQTVLRVGSRESVGDVIRRIRSRLETVSGRA